MVLACWEAKAKVRQGQMLRRHSRTHSWRQLLLGKRVCWRHCGGKVYSNGLQPCSCACIDGTYKQMLQRRANLQHTVGRFTLLSVVVHACYTAACCGAMDGVCQL